jgi:hypothetical protein
VVEWPTDISWGSKGKQLGVMVMPSTSTTNEPSDYEGLIARSRFSVITAIVGDKVVLVCVGDYDRVVLSVTLCSTPASSYQEPESNRR